MVGQGIEGNGEVGSGHVELWATVLQGLLLYCNGTLVSDSGKVVPSDVWQCARWCVCIIEGGNIVGKSQVDSVVYAGARLWGYVVGVEGASVASGACVSGCSCVLCVKKDVVVGSGSVTETGAGNCGRVSVCDGVAGAGLRSFALDRCQSSDRLLQGFAGSSGSFVDSEGEEVVQEKKEKGKNWKKNLARRLRYKNKKAAVSEVAIISDASGSSSAGSCASCGSAGDKKSELASSFDDRRIAENRLATQKAEYQLKKNEYMTRSRVAEQQWETERLTCDQKLQKITEARFGTKPGFAETLVSANISSTSLPSMSQGTLSPDSSISVAEVNKMFKLIADLTAQVAQLTVESKAMKETAVLSAYEQRKLEMENMTFEQIAALRGTEKDIRPDGSPVKYDAIGQEIYSECGRPDFMNQYDYRSSITVSEDGQ